MSEPRSSNGSPSTDKERAVWTSVARISRAILAVAALSILIWMIAFAIEAASLFLGMRSLSVASEGSLGHSWLFAAIGAPSAVLGLCLYLVAVRELRKLTFLAEGQRTNPNRKH